MSMLLELVTKGPTAPRIILAASTIATLVVGDMIFALYIWSASGN
jgi:hypothetical protein